MFYITSLLGICLDFISTASNSVVDANNTGRINSVDNPNHTSIILKRDFCNKFKFFDDLKSRYVNKPFGFALKIKTVDQIKKIFDTIEKDDVDLGVDELFEVLRLLSVYQLKSPFKYSVYKKLIKNSVLGGNVAEKAGFLLDKMESQEQEISDIDIDFWYVLYNEVLHLLNSSLVNAQNSIKFEFFRLGKFESEFENFNTSMITKMDLRFVFFDSIMFKQKKEMFLNLIKCCHLGIFNFNRDEKLISEVIIQCIDSQEGLSMARYLFEETEDSIEKICLKHKYFLLDPAFYNFEILRNFVSQFKSFNTLELELFGHNNALVFASVLSDDSVRRELKELRLNNAQITHKLSECISALQCLEKLGFDSCDMRDSNLRLILESPTLRETLVELNLQDFVIGEYEMECLKKFIALKNLIFTDYENMDAKIFNDLREANISVMIVDDNRI